jgi:hypothetical protein
MPAVKPSISTMACKDCGTVKEKRVKIGEDRYCRRCVIKNGTLTAEEASAILDKPSTAKLDEVDPNWRFW